MNGIRAPRDTCIAYVPLTGRIHRVQVSFNMFPSSGLKVRARLIVSIALDFVADMAAEYVLHYLYVDTYCCGPIKTHSTIAHAHGLCRLDRLPAAGCCLPLAYDDASE